MPRCRPPPSDQAANRHRRGALGGRPSALDKVTYRDRDVVERCFARLKQFRAIATRFDKPGDRYRAGVVLASLILWLRESTESSFVGHPLGCPGRQSCVQAAHGVPEGPAHPARPRLSARRNGPVPSAAKVHRTRVPDPSG